MKLGVLHLSDIHFRCKDDPAIEYGECIAKACYDIANESDAFIIVITGDIAFSGRNSEYELAKNLLHKIKDKLIRETNKEINIFAVPGNHDCTLIPEDEIRTVIIEKIVENPNDIKNSYINECTKVQSDYFDFERDIRDSNPIFEDSLWKEFELSINGETLRISSINAAWMSQLHETQGQLIFPITNYSNYLGEPSSLRLALIHHPMNWYRQASYHKMRQLLKSHCTAILSGHEHSVGSEVTYNSDNGNTLMLEGPALQPHEKDLDPQFTCLLFNTIEKIVHENRFKATNTTPIRIGEINTLSFDTEKKVAKQNQITQSYQKTLMDPGGNFIHPERGALSAEDIFIYPELEEEDPETITKKTVSADKILLKGEKILILGDDEGGKTFLLQKYFLDLHTQGELPLYLKSEDIKSITDREVEKSINNAIEEQYSNPEEFKYSEKSKKTILLDDIDRIKSNLKVLDKLLSILESKFQSVILTANISFNITELTDIESSQKMINYKNYKIKPFGHLLRGKLIQKWCGLDGNIITKTDLDKKTHGAETLLNGILGRSIVPAKPVYLIIFLQSSEQGEQGELQNSSFSYYYQYLITKSLKEAGHRPNELDEIFSYLSQLAWNFKSNDRKELSTSELKVFTANFSEEFTFVDFEQRIHLLRKAKILAKNGDYYKFTYTYIYYLFVGKYLNDNLHEPEIISVIDNYCKKLYIRENANTIMFLTHYSSDPRVTNSISSILDSCFSDTNPLDLNSDMRPINSLVDSTAHLVIKNLDVTKNQEESRIIKDKLESNENYESNKNQEAQKEEKETTINLSSECNLAFRTSEILSHICKNYYGSIKKDHKSRYIDSIFNSSLRTLNKLFSEVLEQPEKFIAEIYRLLSEKAPIMDDEEKKSLAKKYAFQFIGLLVTSIIAKTGEWVSSEKLRQDLERSVKNNETHAYRLIGVAACLTQPGHIPFDTLEKLSKDLKSNKFTFSILQTLILNHLYMFHTTDIEKQKLSDIAQISIQQFRAIDNSSRKSKQNKN